MNNAEHATGLLTLSNADYHAAPGLSSTQLKTISASPLAYWDAYINPEREPREDKHCFLVGDGTHKLVLEPGTFEQTYAVGFDKTAFPDALDTVADLKKACSERGLMVSGAKPELVERLVDDGFPASKIMLALERGHQKTMAGRLPIPARDYKNMVGMLKAISNDPIASGLIAGADAEQSFFWRDEEWLVPDADGVLTPLLRKCRTDFIPAAGGIIGDVKTTDDVSEEGFGRAIANYGYHISAAWYLDVLKGLYGKEAPTDFAFVAVQSKRPFDVAVHFLTERQIHLGRLLYRKNLSTLIECMHSGVWPGVARGEPIEAKLPAWEMQKLDYLEAGGLA
jgi:PDDEXK-like domain of unknown function (DUF3799)/SAP domain